MINLILLTKIIAAIIIFFHSVCRMTRRQWKFTQVEIWAYPLLASGAVATVALAFLNPQNSSAIVGLFTDIGLALLFGSQTLRLMRIHSHGKHPKP